MKELSIEEKAKAYDEAIEKAKEYFNSPRTCFDIEQLCNIFPELTESEDDGIIKDMIETIKKEAKDFPSSVIAEKSKSWIVWLEKQGTSYTKKDVDDVYLKGVTDTKKELEKQYEETYQIRKDIATFIFNYRGDIKDRAKWMDYLGIKVSFVEKQGEQKPIACSDGTVDNSLEGIINAAIYWGKEAPTENGIIPEDKVKGAVDYYCSLIRNNDAWSEEDDTMLNEIIASVNGFDATSGTITMNFGKHEAKINWLKTIKYKALAQLSDEWSEEDESLRRRCIGAIDMANLSDYTKDNLLNWLKSLRPKNTWKPSDEQMNVLNEVIRNPYLSTAEYNGLIALREQLKAL